MFGNDWDIVFREEIELEYFNDICYVLVGEYKI